MLFVVGYRDAVHAALTEVLAEVDAGSPLSASAAKYKTNCPNPNSMKCALHAALTATGYADGVSTRTHVRTRADIHALPLTYTRTHTRTRTSYTQGRTLWRMQTQVTGTPRQGTV